MQRKTLTCWQSSYVLGCRHGPYKISDSGEDFNIWVEIKDHLVGCRGKKQVCEAAGIIWPRVERRKEMKYDSMVAVKSLISSNSTTGILPSSARWKAEQITMFALKGHPRGFSGVLRPVWKLCYIPAKVLPLLSWHIHWDMILGMQLSSCFASFMLTNYEGSYLIHLLSPSGWCSTLTWN